MRGQELVAAFVCLAVTGCGGIATLGGTDDAGLAPDGSAAPIPDAHHDARTDRGADVVSADDGADAVHADARVDAPGSEPSRLEAGRDAPRSDAPAEASSSLDGATDAAFEVGGGDSGLPASCDDNVMDGMETDVDCGGPVCRGCGVSQACLVNSDCGTAPGCDPVHGCACDGTTNRCVYDHCVDHKLDEGETAIDCGGGTCTGCPPGDACNVDADCGAYGVAGCNQTYSGCFCDGISFTCVDTHCVDHKLDVEETAIDCGGGICPGCGLGQACLIDEDCASSACDGVSLVCVSDPCDDHRQDGVETDVDCGGTTCSRCPAGDRCITTSDCAPPLTCNPGNPHLCE
jgi:hypothetical protein